MTKINYQAIESKWRKYWESINLNQTKTSFKNGEKKFYILDMFPYPSGEGLHVGHPKGYIATDIYSRYMKMNNYNVLHPMGFDAFGLPAEQYAIKHKLNPKIATEKNIQRYKEQLDMLGLDYDWEREVNTTDPNFYKWTQWMFKQMYKVGLTYQSNEPINWCPSCQTGLANEDLDGNVCERCGSIVEKRPLRQWVIRIIDYADRLLDDLDKLNWEPHIKELQRNWIGKSIGSEIEFQIVRANIFGFDIRTNYDTDEELFKTGRKRSVAIIRIKDTDKFLGFIKRDDRDIHLAGGGIEKGENSREAAEREAFEEMGIKNLNHLGSLGSFRGFEYYELFEVEENYKKNLSGSSELERDENSFIEFTKEDILKNNWQQVSYVFNNLDSLFNNSVLENKLKIFTTRADTLYGATFMAISYSLAKQWIKEGWVPSEEIRKFIEKLENDEKGRSVEFDMNKLEKEGIDTGIKAINPVNNEEIPIYIANYILSDYGTGAIMAVPAHDERDYEFAKKYGLEIKKIILGEHDEENQLFTGHGILINSGEFDGMNSEEVKIKITEKVHGKIVSQYKLKDWVFARQRYWGEPFPIVFDENNQSFAVADTELPIKLPEIENYEPSGDGQSPLAKIKDWVEVYGFINSEGEFESLEKDNPKAKKFYRETNTMPQWAGSSWYYLRYIDPNNQERFVGKELEKVWDPVDFYVGGAEHATRHLIYARFWHKFLFDQGLVEYDEPFLKLQTVGLIMAEDGRKMSKRYGNVVNPDEVVKEYGADTMRAYEMFMGPFEKSTAWSTKNILGVYRFLERVYDLSLKLKNNYGSDNREVERVINESVEKVGNDILEFKFNTAISQLMICLNTLEDNLKKGESFSKESLGKFIKILSPFAIFITEEIWQEVLGNQTSIHQESWPKFDKNKTIVEEIELSIQINGKFRGTIKVKVNLDKEEAMKEIKSTEIFKKYVEDENKIKNIILVKNRLINIII